MSRTLLVLERVRPVYIIRIKCFLDWKSFLKNSTNWDPNSKEKEYLLHKLQLAIENELYNYTDVDSFYARCPDLLSQIIKSGKQSANEFLLERQLTKIDKSIVNRFDKYGLELVCIQVLSLLFNEKQDTTMTKMSKFVQQLENYVRF